jgi:hypothetical protein
MANFATSLLIGQCRAATGETCSHEFPFRLIRRDSDAPPRNKQAGKKRT